MISKKKVDHWETNYFYIDIVLLWNRFLLQKYFHRNLYLTITQNSNNSKNIKIIIDRWIWYRGFLYDIKFA